MGKRAGVFCDINNQFYAASHTHQGARINYERFLALASEGYDLHRAFAYGAQMADEAVPFIACLRGLGYEVKYRQAITVGKTQDIRRTDRRLMMAMDIWRVIEFLDVVVIGSSDPELVPLVQRIKELGRQVTVISCNISLDLRQACDRYIEIGPSLLEKRTPVEAS